MITFSALLPHIRRTLLVAGFLCFATPCASLLFVFAHGDNSKVSSTNVFDPTPTQPAAASSGIYTVTLALSGVDFVPSPQAFNKLSASQTANFATPSQSFVVTNVNDEGTGSLREAILNANATSGADTIVFSLPGSGVKRISLQTPLPEITETITIDGTTQPGYASTPLVEIDGAALFHTGDNGLVIKAGGSTVRGLALGNFSVAAGIELRSCDNNVIQSNYIGVDATGTLPRPNNIGIRLSNSANNMIGGTTPAARNLISGNRSSGVHIDGSNNVVQGNFIGTVAAGTAPLDNTVGVVIIFESSTNNLIGGLSAGAGNLISGNGTGVDIRAPGTTVQGNLIGTDVTGTKRVRNGSGIQSSSQNVQIGGLLPGARNIISGNGDGVSISGNGSKVQGNFIGTDVTGTLALGNGSNGVTARNNVLIGGTVPEARNVISGNGDFSDNLFIFGGPGVIVQGNYIGTDVTGTRALNPKSIGISVFGDNNLIGGTLPEAQNVISGNSTGIRIDLLSSGNTIQGNLIGLNAQGTGPLPNVFAGIECSFNSSDNTIGGTAPGAGNKIAFNGGPGVRLSEGTRTAVRGNSIFSNGGLGIDLGPEGVTANDDFDADAGPNNLQNFPVLTSVMFSGNSTSIQGTLNSTPNATFQIDFYSSAALDPSGNGEGASFFGSTSITTDSNGNANINVTFPVSLGSRRVVTATATDADGNTSEFSMGDATGLTGNVQFSLGAIQVLEDIGLLNITVLRKGGSTGNLTVDFATADGTAIGGQDYTSTSATLNFGDGETSKSLQVQITDDATIESDETFALLLRNASSPEMLGAPAILVVNIEDSDSTRTLSLQNNFVSVPEGNAGSTTEMLFTVNLSASSLRTVRVDFATEKISAIGDASCGNQAADFETALGTIIFPPGSTSADISISVCGDLNPELDETFRLRFLNPINVTLDGAVAFGSIVDDDVFELLRDESGPGDTQVAALDAISLLRDPFRVQGIPEWFPNVPDRNTRVILFVRNLQLDPGELPSSVTVRLRSDLLQFQDTPAVDVRSLPNTDLTQVTFRLPDNLPAGIYLVHIRARGRSSNTATIRIAL